ncbi:uncharacterized protein LOC108951859 [Musa acuminata AAA Group]|uniref:uncharacterized protein LOC108951859 n=1 Tax=Musa acuminata AAA Group TaxID=214697 RepID=UPI0031CF320B
MKPMSSVGAGFINHDHGSKLRESKAEFTPIGVMLGLVLMALTIGAHAANQQLAHSPGARVSKKKREMMAEVEEPEHVAGEADRFVTKSFSRKVAHLQDLDAVRSDPSPPSIPSKILKDEICVVVTISSVVHLWKNDAETKSKQTISGGNNTRRQLHHLFNVMIPAEGVEGLFLRSVIHNSA